MAAQQTQLEIVADNVANADVAGFKSAVETFADVRAGSIGTTSVGKRSVSLGVVSAKPGLLPALTGPRCPRYSSV
jgi:flagellar hook protein FlgE